MIWLLKFLIMGHVHKWVEYKRGSITCDDFMKTRTKGIAVFCSCEKCGAHRVFRLIATD